MSLLSYHNIKNITDIIVHSVVLHIVAPHSNMGIVNFELADNNEIGTIGQVAYSIVPVCMILVKLYGHG